jgi:hypothetical protein
MAQEADPVQAQLVEDPEHVVTHQLERVGAGPVISSRSLTR